MYEFKSDEGASTWIRLDMICGIREFWAGSEKGDREFRPWGSTVSACGSLFVIDMLPRDLITLMEDRSANPVDGCDNCTCNRDNGDHDLDKEGPSE